MRIKINKKIYDANPEDTVLDVCRHNGIRIPTLCHHPDLLPSEGICRMCFVETNQSKGLVAACVRKVSESLEVFTETENVNKARKLNLELLWADHAGKCAKCQRNGRCELQNLAKVYDVDEFKFVPRRGELKSRDELDLVKDNWSHVVVDGENPCLKRNSEYCVECRRCVRVCRDLQAIEALGMNFKSSRTNVGTPYERELDCIFCGQCAVVCPTAAIVERDDTMQFEKALADPKKMVIVQVAPSVRFTFSEEFGGLPGELWEGKLVASLSALGCDKIFDTALAADLTIVEEAKELVKKIRSGKKSPMFTSCCPSWVLYVEKYHPEFIPHLSTCKSPQQMLGALVKTYYAKKVKINPKNIVHVSIMPCTSKKYEADRKEMNAGGFQDVDLVLTIRELARLLRKKGISPTSLNDARFDSPLGISTGAGVLFASSGGVMEAALRTALEELTGSELGKLELDIVRGESNCRSGEIEADGRKLRVAVVHGIGNAKRILHEIRQGKATFDFVEVMACPNGCIGGGGQPYPTDPKTRHARIQAVLKRDKGMPVRKSHENPAVKKIYNDFLGHPGSDLAQELLHTKYIKRKK